VIEKIFKLLIEGMLPIARKVYNMEIIVFPLRKKKIPLFLKLKVLLINFKINNTTSEDEICGTFCQGSCFVPNILIATI
jgi:hypothetical protein